MTAIVAAETGVAKIVAVVAVAAADVAVAVVVAGAEPSAADRTAPTLETARAEPAELDSTGSFDPQQPGGAVRSSHPCRPEDRDAEGVLVVAVVEAVAGVVVLEQAVAS